MPSGQNRGKFKQSASRQPAASTVPVDAISLPPWPWSRLQLPPGSPLPREILLELRCPGDALFFVHECVLPCGLAVRYGVIHVRDPVASGLSAGRALSCIARAYREVFRALASSTHPALLLKPPGCARLPLHQSALPSMAMRGAFSRRAAYPPIRRRGVPR